MLLLKYDTDGNESIVDVKKPLYKSLEEMLGSYPEHVRPRGLRRPYCMMVDDEGLLKGLPENPIGSYLYETDVHGHPIVGDIYIAKERPNMTSSYDIVGLTDSDIAIIQQNVCPIISRLKG